MVIGKRDIWVKKYRDTGYLGGKLNRYGIFKKRFQTPTAFSILRHFPGYLLL